MPKAGTHGGATLLHRGKERPQSFGSAAATLPQIGGYHRGSKNSQFQDSHSQPEKGQNAVEKSAYISRTTLKCERDGQTYYPKYSEDLVYSEVMLSEGAPERLKDRAVLWNEIENIEKRQDAQVARTCHDLAFAEVISYNKTNLERTLQNESRRSRQPDHEQTTQKKRRGKGL